MGHGAGCRGEKLAAFATHADNDHEAVSGDEIRERVRVGIHAVGRSGSIRDDIKAFADAHGDVPLSALSLSTDGMWPRDLLARGHMDEVLRRAVDAGVPPVDAVRTVTETTAHHFGLDDRGLLAPGRVADVVLLSDLESVAVETVVADDLDAVEAAMREQGVDADQPVIAVATLTFFGVPALKLTPWGYADILGRRVVGLTPGA